MKSVFNYLIIIAVTFLLVVVVKTFFVGSYRIIGEKLGETLKAGDYVLVNKMKISNNPERNRLILFKSPLRRDTLKPPVFVGRCVGLPNDTVQMEANGFRINGQLMPNMPLMQPTFRIHKDIKNNILTAMDILNIPLRDLREDSANIMMRLSLREKELLVNNLSKALKIEMIECSEGYYEFVIPCRNKKIMIDPVSLIIYSEAILKEAGNKAEIINNKLIINGKEVQSFVFSKNYYWVLSENESEGIDSRHLGLIPADHIFGNIWFCLYSKDPAHCFKTIK